MNIYRPYNRHGVGLARQCGTGTKGDIKLTT